MKKLLLLILIAPMIGNSQTLDLPISALDILMQVKYLVQNIFHQEKFGKLMI